MSRSLELVPRGLVSREYELQEGGAAIGGLELRHLSLRDMGSVTTAGQTLRVSRESVMRSRYALTGPDGAVRATAERRGISGTSYEVQAGSASVLLKKKALSLHETYVLGGPAGEEGRIVRESLLSRAMTMELDGPCASLPVPTLLFLAWLALEIRAREAASA